MLSKGPSCHHNALSCQQHFTVASQSLILPSQCPNNVCSTCTVMVVTFSSHNLLMNCGFHPRALLHCSNALFAIILPYCASLSSPFGLLQSTLVIFECPNVPTQSHILSLEYKIMLYSAYFTIKCLVLPSQ